MTPGFAVIGRSGLAAVLAFAIGGCVTPAAPSVAPGSSMQAAPSIHIPSPMPAPTASGAATPDATSTGWLAAPDQESVRNSQFRDVAWTGERFVAIATLIEAGAGLLASADGRDWTWQSEPRPPNWPVSVAAGPGGVVAIGTINGELASWFSTDGLEWTSNFPAFPTDAHAPSTDAVDLTDVVATDTGWLAVGREDPYCNMNCGLAPVRSMTWISTDGLHWTRGKSQDSLAGAALLSVTRHSSGFVAVGLADLHAAAWTSTDGLSWTRVADDPSFHAAASADPSGWTSMEAVASGHGTVVAVGFDGPGGAHGPAARAWWSADGLTWASADGEGFLSGGKTSVRLAAVTAAPHGFVAVGSSDGRCSIGIWESPDGRSWECTSGADQDTSELIPYSVAASGSVAVVVGLANMPYPPLDGLPGAVWTRRLP